MNDSELNEKITDASKTVFSYCRARTNSRQDAEELCQDILLELVKSYGSIREKGAFYGFMWAVAGNVYKQWLRKKSTLIACELTEDIVSAANPAVALEESENEEIYLLRRELTLLSEKYRRAVIMYYVENKSCRQIADILKISESMVKYLLFKSRQKLKEGMNMARKLGTLSYAPKSLIPLYMGSGPNFFWDFMRGSIRQNIVAACYNDSLTAEGISLETGIPLPYLDEEINALTSRGILLQNGNHYKAGVVTVTAECAEEIGKAAKEYQKKTADKISGFLEKNMDEFKKTGFYGSDFSENSLRWLMTAFLLREVVSYDRDVSDYPITAWGDRAYIWLEEKSAFSENNFLNFSQVTNRNGDGIYFVDYHPAPKADYLVFYNNQHYTEVFCDVAKGNVGSFSENDIEILAELIKKGYVIRESDSYRSAMPVFTSDQYDKAVKLTKRFVENELKELIKILDRHTERILGEHTPSHLQGQVNVISKMYRFVNAVCVPIKYLIEEKKLRTDWKPSEIGTDFAVLNK